MHVSMPWIVTLHPVSDLIFGRTAIPARGKTKRLFRCSGVVIALVST
jgi:hypothetical protein